MKALWIALGIIVGFALAVAVTANFRALDRLETALRTRVAAESAERMTICRAYWQWSGATRDSVEGMEAYCK